MQPIPVNHPDWDVEHLRSAWCDGTWCGLQYGIALVAQTPATGKARCAECTEQQDKFDNPEESDA